MKRVAILWLCIGVDLCFGVRFAEAQGARGIAVFEEHCAQCHAAPAPDSRAPSRDSLRERTPESILDAMTSGAMMEQARSLTVEQRRQVAEYIAGRPLGATASGDASSMPNRCPAALSDRPLTDPAK